MKAMTIIGLTALAMGAGVSGADAKNLVVGPVTCEPTIKVINRFTTIQAAVNAALPTDVVLVCPGQYPEQVLIEKAITLKGTADPSGGNLAVITRPVAAGGGYQAPALIVESLHYGNVPNHDPQPLVAPQVLVRGAGASYAKVLNLAVDGGFEPHASTASCPAGPTAYRSVGIFFKDIGIPTDVFSGGTIGNVSVRNQYDGCLGGNPATQGTGVLIENSYIMISDSNIHSIIGDGIIGRGGTVSISRNFLMDVTGYSVWVFDGNQSDVRNNTIIHTGEAILVHLSATTDVISNAIGPYVGVGIHLANDTGSAVQSNRMVYNTTGIWVNESAAATVTGNIVQRSGTGIIDKYSFGGTNVIKTNEVNEANVGISSYATSTDILTPNTFTNVAIATQVAP